METRTINVYTFSELSPRAKDRARQWFAADGWSRETEYMASIEALAEHFGGKIADYSLDWSNSCGPSSMKFDMPDDLTAVDILDRMTKLGGRNEETGRGTGDCVLTGYCYDESAIDGFRMAWDKGERDLTALMSAAFKEWIKDAWADYEYDTGDEGLSETADANEWKFTEEGKFWKEGSK